MIRALRLVTVDAGGHDIVGGVVASMSLWMDMIERQVLRRATINTLVVPVFFDGGPPHALCFGCGHGL